MDRLVLLSVLKIGVTVDRYFKLRRVIQVKNSIYYMELHNNTLLNIGITALHFFVYLGPYYLTQHLNNIVGMRATIFCFP